MAKEICISTTPHETRLAILEDDLLAEIYYERENEYTLAGSIYKGRVTRVLPGMQSSFVDVGLERDAFLYVTDFLEEQEDSEEYASDGNGGGRPDRLDRKNAEPGDPSQMQGRAAAPERSGQERAPERGGADRNADRNQDRGRRPVAAPLPDSAREAGRAGRDRIREQIREQTVAPLREAIPAARDLEEKGDEESPEGTRRWRGRRGRRRGMRAGLPPIAPRPLLSDSPQALEEASTAEQSAAAPFSIVEHGAPGGIATLYASPESRQKDRARHMEPGRDRSPRPPREPYALVSSFDRPARESEDAGTEPRRNGAPSSASGPVNAGGVIVLPGESLSKYGSAPADPATLPAATATVPKTLRPVNYVAPRPSTLIELSDDWDGGAVLPGETLSRYRPSASPASPALTSVHEQLEPQQAGAAQSEPEHAPADEWTSEPLSADTGSDQIEAPVEQADLVDDAHRDETAETDLEQPALASMQTDDAEALSSQRWEPRQSTVVENAAFAEPEILAFSPTADTPAALAAEPEQSYPDLAQASAQEHRYGQPGAEELSEYEPENASASYRVQPTGPRELRLASPEPDEQTFDRAPGEELVPERQTHSMTLAEPFGQFADAAPVPAPTWASDADEEFPEFSGTLAAQSDPGLYPDVSPVPESEHRAPALHVLHEDGTVELAGPYVDASSSYAEPEIEPLEASGFEPTLSLAAQLQEEEAQQAELPSANFSEMVDRMQGFAPGHGLLEEETIDEDEYDFEPMHAHAHSDDGDQEDLEEETLDQRMEPSALSDAVRDSRLEQRVKQEQEQEQARDQEQTPEAASFVAQRSEAAFRYEEVGEEEFEEEGDEPAHEAEPGEPQRAGRSDESRNRGRGRSSGGRNGRRNGGAGHGRGRSAQSQDLPIISELLKQGQEILVQIAKEPIAKKGARITSHIALPGRFLVFMPTVHHVGVSRKIESDEERQRLKRILISEKGDASGGFIVRTAAEGASEEDLRADLRFLISLWTEVKQRSETAKAPALIYHDLNLIERILRDQVSSNFSTIWVDSEAEYERIIRFLSRFQPQLVRRVKLYTKETPLFEHFGIQEEISKALKSKVWLKSGGSIVINQTEALVAIDINTGKFVGKTSRLEDTIVKTNLDAIPEIVRQIRLRDLGGIIVIDFIDMDERKNRNRVLAALEEELKNDRAPSKVLQFNDFGLVAITRKRVKQSLERTLSVQCETCTGTGMVKSPITVCNEIYTEMRKMMKHLDGKDVMLRVNPEVVKQLKANNGRWINELEEMVTKTIIIKSDPALHPEQFDIH